MQETERYQEFREYTFLSSGEMRYGREEGRSVNIRRSFQKEEGYHVEPPPYELIKREGMERGLEIGAEKRLRRRGRQIRLKMITSC